MYEWLIHYQIPTLVVATKADKISRGNWQKHLKEIKTKMKILPNQPMVLFSAETGQGLEEVHQWIEEKVQD